MDADAYFRPAPDERTRAERWEDAVDALRGIIQDLRAVIGRAPPKDAACAWPLQDLCDFADEAHAWLLDVPDYPEPPTSLYRSGAIVRFPANGETP